MYFVYYSPRLRVSDSRLNTHWTRFINYLWKNQSHEQRESKNTGDYIVHYRLFTKIWKIIFSSLSKKELIFELGKKTFLFTTLYTLYTL